MQSYHTPSTVNDNQNNIFPEKNRCSMSILDTCSGSPVVILLLVAIVVVVAAWFSKATENINKN